MSQQTHDAYQERKDADLEKRAEAAHESITVQGIDDINSVYDTPLYDDLHSKMLSGDKVVIFLNSGIKLDGEIVSAFFTDYACGLYLEKDGNSQFVNLSAVATIV